MRALCYPGTAFQFSATVRVSEKSMTMTGSFAPAVLLLSALMVSGCAYNSAVKSNEPVVTSGDESTEETISVKERPGCIGGMDYDPYSITLDNAVHGIIQNIYSVVDDLSTCDVDVTFLSAKENKLNKEQEIIRKLRQKNDSIDIKDPADELQVRKIIEGFRNNLTESALHKILQPTNIQGIYILSEIKGANLNDIGFEFTALKIKLENGSLEYELGSMGPSKYSDLALKDVLGFPDQPESERYIVTYPVNYRFYEDNRNGTLGKHWIVTVAGREKINETNYAKLQLSCLVDENEDPPRLYKLGEYSIVIKTEGTLLRKPTHRYRPRDKMDTSGSFLCEGNSKCTEGIKGELTLYDNTRIQADFGSNPVVGNRKLTARYLDSSCSYVYEGKVESVVRNDGKLVYLPNGIGTIYFDTGAYIKGEAKKYGTGSWAGSNIKPTWDKYAFRLEGKYTDGNGHSLEECRWDVEDPKIMCQCSSSDSKSLKIEAGGLLPVPIVFFSGESLYPGCPIPTFERSSQ